jgi:hypothetical protein
MSFVKCFAHAEKPHLSISIQVSFGDRHTEEVNLLLNEMTDDGRYIIRDSRSASKQAPSRVSSPPKVVTGFVRGDIGTSASTSNNLHPKWLQTRCSSTCWVRRDARQCVRGRTLNQPIPHALTPKFDNGGTLACDYLHHGPSQGC